MGSPGVFAHKARAKGGDVLRKLAYSAIPAPSGEIMRAPIWGARNPCIAANAPRCYVKNEVRIVKEHCRRR